ncbi:thioredoxin-like protein [Auriscalpium vulgare]|uniref:Thioredoxin-like protein n=1 Tax=Auriscalpium vulgare TaxID=40419 RepID=A0ACB8RGM1_9AGAM|nr:thioredoxin-like protein [Auriscalpium vulgare]
MDKRSVKLVVISDFTCPWCFIGHQELLKAIAQCANLPVVFDLEYRPFVLHQTLPTDGLDKDEWHAKRFGREKWQQAKQIVLAKGEEANIQFSFGGPICVTLQAHRLMAKAYDIGGSSQQLKLTTLIFRAYCEEEQDISRDDVLADLAVQAEMMSKEKALAFLATDECLAKTQHQIAEARSKGVTGVPFTIIDGKWAVSGGQTAPVFVKIFSKLAQCSDSPPSQAGTPLPVAAAA